MNQLPESHQEESIIAIADNKEEAVRGNWLFITFPDRETALVALQDAKNQGKIAVYYQNGFDELPPEI